MQSKYSVLVIDDQENWRQLLAEVLADQFEVVTASSFQEAREIIEKRHPPFHVVLTDMRLVDQQAGNEEGLDVVAYLNQRGDETKAVVITGYATIDSAKQALSRLDAFDYIEKVPSKGVLSLNVQELKRIVFQASQEAEEKRTESFRDLSLHILLCEPDPAWRERLRNILVEAKYQVDAVDPQKLITHSLDVDARRYALILINESLAYKAQLDWLHESYPDAGFVILSAQDIDTITKAMREYPVVTAQSLHHEKFDARSFRELIHSSLANGALKYVSCRVIDKDGELTESPKPVGRFELRIGTTYTVSLSIHDRAAEFSQPILLLPRQVKKGSIHLHLFLHAEQMRIFPGAEADWKIPLVVERPRTFDFTVTPQITGESTILIELEHNKIYLGRITIRTQINDGLTERAG